MPTPPAWYVQWCRLGPAASDYDRLPVCQAIRDADVLPPDAGFYLVSWQIDAISTLVADVELANMDQQLRAIERQYGLEDDEFFLPSEAPQEYERVRLQSQDAWDRIFVRLMRRYGETEMADLFERNHDEFERRSESGRVFFHGTAWIDELAESVAAQLTADSPMGPLMVRCTEDAGLWEMVIAPTPIELLGGAVDGEIVSPGFSLDLEGLRDAFDEVLAAGWSALGLPEDDGPYVWMEGVFQGHEVLLRVMACAPDDEEPSVKVDVTRRSPP
jgi:hypothetical protein